MKDILTDYLQRIWYEIFWLGITLTLRFYFKRWQRVNYPKLKRNTPTIYAANHQNAFLDALSIIMSQDRHPMFLTRANIFQSNFAAFWLRSINMMPIYRIRDGLRSVAKNDKIIDECVNILTDGRKPLSIFPEGNHNLHRFLRPLQKGLCRIAFTAMERNNFNLDLKIVPIGISYSKHTKVRSDLLVNFGDPIDVLDYVELYKENPNNAYTALKNEISARIKPLIIDIASPKHYKEIETAWLSKKVRKSNLLEELHSDQLIVASLLNKEVGTSPVKPGIRHTSMLAKVAGFPLYLYGKINTLPVHWLIDRLIKKVVTDIHFYGSVKMVSAMALGTIFFLLQTWIVLVLTGNYFYAGLYLFSLPFAASFAYDYHDKYIHHRQDYEPSSNYLK